MAKIWYYIPKTQTHWECEADSDVDAIEVIKSIEDIKRVPPTWKIWIEKNGEMIEVNRRAISRHRQEMKEKKIDQKQRR
jgi:hypothetical protein